MNAPELTVLIPVYNECQTIIPLLEAVARTNFKKQIIVIDDGSTDDTISTVGRWQARTSYPLMVIGHIVNLGKGAAIRTGLDQAQGSVVIIQDADLEYDPSDYAKLVQPILDGLTSVVFGSRYLNENIRLPWTINRVCVKLLNFLVRILYNTTLTDEATCYKVFRRDLLLSLNLQCERFEFCPEVTAKICRLKVPILEVPISYSPRTHAQGKKICWRDGIQAILTLVRWRFQSIDSFNSALYPAIKTSSSNST